MSVIQAEKSHNCSEIEGNGDAGDIVTWEVLS